MKKYVLLFLFAVTALYLKAQEYDPNTAPYKKDPKLPEIKILQADSTWFTDLLIPEDKPVIIMYFSPECGHCQIEAESLAKNKDILDSAFMVFVSYHSPGEVGDFVKKYRLDKFRYMAAGRDTEYYLPTFFRVQQTPFIAVYSKYHRLVKVFEAGASAEELSQLIK